MQCIYRSLPKMSRLNAGLTSSQMPYAVSIGLQFLFRELSYRFVKLAEYCGFVIRQRSRYRYRIGNMMTQQIDPDIQTVDKYSHLNQSLNFWFLNICTVQYLLI